MVEKTNRDVNPNQAREALRDAEMKTAAAAGRLPETAWWFELSWLAIIAGLVFSAAVPRPFDILLLAGLIFALGTIVHLYRKRYGVWVSGYRPGKTRYVTIALTVIIACAVLGTRALYNHYGLFWIVPAGAAVAVLAGVIFGRLWMAAYRSETGARS